MSHTHSDSNHPHHQDAAKHHDLASKAHTEAHKLQQSGKHDEAANQSLVAHGHAIQAVEHSEDALKKHANKASEIKKS